MMNVEPRVEEGRSSGPNPHPDDDEILKLIKRSEYKIVEQLLQTPSKICAHFTKRFWCPYGSFDEDLEPCIRRS